MIRKIRNDEQEIDEVMAIWARGNMKNHSFIDKDFWLEKYTMVKQEVLPLADTYVYEEEVKNGKEIKGFISVLNESGYVGCLFVNEAYKNNGIGRKLINFCKNKYDQLIMKIYKENTGAMIFGVKMGFKNIESCEDMETGQVQHIMMWQDEN